MTREKTEQLQKEKQKKQTIKATMNEEQIQTAKRLHKGREIFEAGLVQNIGQDFYSVRSQTKNKEGKEYCIDIINNSCSCKDNEFGNLCKHIIAVNLYRTDKIKQSLTTAQMKVVGNLTTAAAAAAAAATSTKKPAKKIRIGIVQ